MNNQKLTTFVLCVGVLILLAIGIGLQNQIDKLTEVTCQNSDMSTTEMLILCTEVKEW